MPNSTTTYDFLLDHATVIVPCLYHLDVKDIEEKWPSLLLSAPLGVVFNARSNSMIEIFFVFSQCYTFLGMYNTIRGDILRDNKNLFPMKRLINDVRVLDWSGIGQCGQYNSFCRLPSKLSSEMMDRSYCSTMSKVQWIDAISNVVQLTHSVARWYRSNLDPT